MEKGEYEVVVISHPAGISNGCKDCRKILAEGKYVLGLRIKEPDHHYQYLVAVDPPIMCCGVDKKVLYLFNTEEEAKKKAEEIADYLDKHETTEGLRLFVTNKDF